MFSPSAWLSENETTVNDESDASYLSELNSNPPSIHQTPKNPIDEFHRMQHQKIKDSPNAKLAEFFARKGNEPLSEIELEGVKALLEKTNSTPSSPKTPKGEKEEQRIEVLKPKDGESAVKTTPSFKATYNNTVSSENSFESSTTSSFTNGRKRRVFDFTGFPSPYRTSRLKESSFLLDDDRNKREVSSEAKIEPPKEEKKLSNTASALLSFIENHESSEVKAEEPKTKKNVDYSNPYASISTSHKKTKKPTNRKPTAFEQLEKTLATSTQPEVPIINKYKPTKSSSLRESISLNDQSVDEIEVDEPEQTEPEEKQIEEQKPPEPVPSFSFKAPEPPKTIEPISEKPSEPKPTFNSKPLFSFAPKPTIPSPSQELDIQNTQQNNENSLQSKPFSLNGTTLNHDTRPPSSEFTFRFPNAESLGYTTSDLNDQKVANFKTYFTF